MSNEDTEASIIKAKELGYTVLEEECILHPPFEGSIYVQKNDGVIPQYKFAFNAKHCGKGDL